MVGTTEHGQEGLVTKNLYEQSLKEHSKNKIKN